MTTTATLKAGYKMTEIGMIPEDWELCSIEDLVSRELIEKPIDGNHGNIHPKSGDFVEEGIPFVMANNVTNGSIDYSTCNFIKKSQADRLQKGFSVTGDVLLTHKGTVGNVAIVGKLQTPYVMLTPQVTYYRVKQKDKISNNYIRYYFETKRFQSILTNLSGGGTRAYIGITKQRELPFVLPPTLAEQEAIATILFSTDELISSLDALIAKKRRIKEGAMQELLAGKKRLAGFSGEWEVKKLDEIFLISAGRDLVKEDYSSFKDHFHQYPIYSNSLENKGLYGFTKIARHSKNCLTITARGTIGRSNKRESDFDAIGRLLVLEPRQKLDGFFFSEYLNNKVKFSIESTGVPQLTAPQASKYEIAFPKLAEQIAIATVLFDMDSEITALEEKREKYRLVKQGMMQVLLTGKIRLI